MSGLPVRTGRWLVCALALSACGQKRSAQIDQTACSPANVSRDGWQRVDPGPFSLEMPREFSRVNTQAIDSRAGTYRSPSGDVQISYDFGWYSNDLSPQSTLIEYARCTTAIGGRPVTVVVGKLQTASVEAARFVVAGAWRNVESGTQPVHLTVWTTARDSAQTATLRAVVGSVRFDTGTAAGH